jgi:glycosyltransferase involved in cell wall biosynthesis
MSEPTSNMRVLVAPHNFEIGGSQINALELACAVSRTPGFEVILYAPDGELAESARQTGLELHTSVLKERAPSSLRIRELSQLVTWRGVDLVHAYEWAPTIDAAIGVAWARGVPVLSTILSMDYPYFLPRDLPTIFGTQEMRETAERLGRKAFLLEPPVDTEIFRPGAISAAKMAEIRSECLAREGDILLVVVGRLAASLKLDGLLALIQAIGRLPPDYKVKLAIIGDGPVRDQVQWAADAVNRSANQNLVQVLGARHDPLPYYASADIVVGMGSSALRAMAVGKPLIVQGERGFWQVADEVSSRLFLSQGWYGIGDGEQSVERCLVQLRALLDASKSRLQQLGSFGRELVEREYSLRAAAETLISIYRHVMLMPKVSHSRGMVNTLNLLVEIAKYETSLKLPWLQTASRRMRGI